MVALKWAERQTIEDAFDMRSGYVLNFFDRFFTAFFGEDLGFDIDDAKYRAGGTSKANRLRTFIAIEDDFMVASVLRRLWDYRESMPFHQQTDESRALNERLFSRSRTITSCLTRPKHASSTTPSPPSCLLSRASKPTASAPKAFWRAPNGVGLYAPPAHRALRPGHPVTIPHARIFPPAGGGG